MAEEITSSWDGEEGQGGLFNEGRVTISDETCFGYHPNYMKGEQICFILKGTTTDEDFPEIENLYSIGKGWELVGDGEAVEGRETFLKSTNYWALVMSAVENGLGATLQSRGESFEAKVWHGLVVDMKRIEYVLPGMVREENARPLSRVLIVGVPDGAQAKGGAKKAAASAKATTKPAAKPAEVEEDGGEEEASASAPAAKGGAALPGKLRLALTKLAKEHADHDDFMAAALDVDGVAGDEVAEDAISASGPGSLWANARK